MQGTTVGNYRVGEKIGEGGIGEVFRAVDLMLDRAVAIKVLRPEVAERAELVALFRSEAQTLARLNHPNIATLYNLQVEGERLFMVMEYVAGRTLSDLVRDGGPMPIEGALPLFAQALDGIGYAHQCGVIHRDIKPANLMLLPSGLIKVMDFGIACVIDAQQEGPLMGTPEYMSPEQIRRSTTDERSDIYSLGVLLYHLLTGRTPFVGETADDVLRAQLERAPLPPRDVAPDLPDRVEAAILRALEKDPARRFESTDEFRAELESLCSLEPKTGLTRRVGNEDTQILPGDGGVSGAQTLPEPDLAEPPEERPTEIFAVHPEYWFRPRWAWGMALVAVLGLALGGNLLLLRGPSPPESVAAGSPEPEVLGPPLAPSAGARPGQKSEVPSADKARRKPTRPQAGSGAKRSGETEEWIIRRD